MNTIDLTPTERAIPCNCCQAPESRHRDRDLGAVCTECFVLLLNVCFFLKWQARVDAKERSAR